MGTSDHASADAFEPSGLWCADRADGTRWNLTRGECLALAHALLAGIGSRGDAPQPVGHPGSDLGGFAERLQSMLDGGGPRGEPCAPEAGFLIAAAAAAARHGESVAGFEKAVAEARLEAVRELAYGAGHEINNPLANIAARAQSLLPGEHDPERRRRLSAIVDQAFRARDMIGGLMVYARPPKPQPAEVAVDAVVRPAVDWLRPQALSRGVRLEYAPPPRPVAVRVDATQVGEAVRMLALNALEAVEHGGHVRIEAAGDPDDHRCRVVIADDGRGMEAEVARRACDPFFSGREAGRGIGLGLPKAARLVESSGGGIVIESRPGVGTRVTVSLPLVEA